MKYTKKGFTLIEMLVVVGVVALILPAVFSIVFAILRQQAKIYALQEIRRQGDLVLNTMRTALKNYAVTAHSTTPPQDANLVCVTSGSSSTGQIYFKDRFNNYFSYSVDSSEIIASSSSIPSATTNLTNSKVKIDPAFFSIKCERINASSPPVVTIHYLVEYNSSSTRPEDTASFTYQTKIQLKSY